MGMSRGSHWKRAAVILSDHADCGEVLSKQYRAYGIQIEWWTRIARGARGRIKEQWAMVQRGDWPLAHVLAKSIKGVRT